MPADVWVTEPAHVTRVVAIADGRAECALEQTGELHALTLGQRPQQRVERLQARGADLRGSVLSALGQADADSATVAWIGPPLAEPGVDK